MPQSSSWQKAKRANVPRISAHTVMAGAATLNEPLTSQIVDVNLGDRSYPIYIGSGLLDNGNLLRKHVGKRVLVVTNTTIAPLYLDR